jgi:hypothetical protein
MDSAIPCSLCGRSFDRRQLTKHHCLPRQKGGTQEHVELLCYKKSILYGPTYIPSSPLLDFRINRTAKDALKPA